MKSFIFISLLLLSFTFCRTYFSVQKQGSVWNISKGKDTEAVATGYFEDTYNTTGWSILSIETNDNFFNNDQMYAAGYLEAYLTKAMISPNYENTFPKGKAGVSDKVLQWLDTNNKYMNQMILNDNGVEWKQVSYLLDQLKGMSDGYTQFRDPRLQVDLDYTDFILLQLAGDMETLSKAAGVSQPTPPNGAESFGQHCSALIKVSNDFTELFSAHTTWAGFSSMLRIYKNYNFPLTNTAAGTSASEIAFSSYPGILSSIDDFYITNQKLNIIETTNGYYVDSLNAFVVPESLLSWVRIMISNRLSKTGFEWTDWFSQYNSGTYNNQWMIVDYKLFTPGKVLPPNLLWVLEQIPGYIHKGDMTEILALGYWPSYNMPYFKDIYDRSGFPIMVEKYGNWFTHELHPRAKIFRRDQYKINDIEGMKYQMQYNNWQRDPFSEGNPGNQISSRFDLVTKNYTDPFLRKNAFGGIDSKVTSSKIIGNLQSWAISGPTHQHPDQTPPFSWKDWPNNPHKSHPEVFNFDWQFMTWN